LPEKPMSASEQQTREAWRSFMRAKTGIRRAVQCSVREVGLTVSQLDILHVLAERGREGMKLHELSQQLGVTSGNVTGLIDNLEHAGHLARVPHAADRRITLAVLTPSGKQLYERVYPSHLERVKHLMSTLTAPERKTLSELLDRLADRAEEMGGKVKGER
jgi:MarR family transcriptional regulator, 2-MHQ and catechol-resistance regulon repressor